MVVTQTEVSILYNEKILANSALQDVLASPQALLVGRTTLIFREPTFGGKQGRWIYDEAQTTAALFARMRPDQLVTQNQLQWAALRRMPGGLAGLLVMVFGMILITYFFGMK